MSIHRPAHHRPLRVGVIGAGTAGLATAIALARLGHRPEVFEKHPAAAPLGAGLLIQPPGLRALKQLGVEEPFKTVSVPVERLLGVSHRGWNLVDVRYGASEARGVSRADLAALLQEKAQRQQVALFYGQEVTEVANGARGAFVKVGKTVHEYDLVVIANGSSSHLPAALGLARPSQVYPWGALWGMFDVERWPQERVLQQRFRGTSVMVGLLPTSRRGNKLRLSFFWSLQAKDYPAWVKAPLYDWVDELVELWPEAEPVVEQIVRHDQLAFASYRLAHATRLAAGHVAMVGDAAHSMSPQLGLGSTLALQDALQLATCVDRQSVALGLKTYSRERLPAVRWHQKMSAMLTPCFQAEGSGLWRDVAFAAGLHVPGVRSLMYRSIAKT